MTDRTWLWPVWLVVALLSAASVLGQSPLAPRSGTGVVASPNTPLIEIGEHFATTRVCRPMNRSSVSRPAAATRPTLSSCSGKKQF